MLSLNEIRDLCRAEEAAKAALDATRALFERTREARSAYYAAVAAKARVVKQIEALAADRIECTSRHERAAASIQIDMAQVEDERAQGLAAVENDPTFAPAVEGVYRLKRASLDQRVASGALNRTQEQAALALRDEALTVALAEAEDALIAAQALPEIDAGLQAEKDMTDRANDFVSALAAARPARARRFALLRSIEGTEQLFSIGGTLHRLEELVQEPGDEVVEVLALDLSEQRELGAAPRVLFDRATGRAYIDPEQIRAARQAKSQARLEEIMGRIARLEGLAARGINQAAPIAAAEAELAAEATILASLN